MIPYITPTGFPCHREPSIVLMTMILHIYITYLLYQIEIYLSPIILVIIAVIFICHIYVAKLFLSFMFVAYLFVYIDSFSISLLNTQVLKMHAIIYLFTFRLC